MIASGEAVIVLLVLFAFAASFTQRVTGFGFGIFIMTILPYILPSYAEATALSGMLAVINVIATMIRKFKLIVWKQIVPIVLTFLTVSFFSIKLVRYVDGHLLRRILGAVLIVISVYFFFISERIKVRPTVPVQIGLGTISGIMGGFFAIQGPPAVIYFISSTEDKEQYIAHIATYFVIGNLMMTAFRAYNGFVTPAVLRSWLVAAPAVVAGYFVGQLVYDKMPIAVLRKVVYAFMAVSGAVAMLL